MGLVGFPNINHFKVFLFLFPKTKIAGIQKGYWVRGAKVLVMGNRSPLSGNPQEREKKLVEGGAEGV